MPPTKKGASKKNLAVAAKPKVKYPFPRTTLEPVFHLGQVTGLVVLQNVLEDCDSQEGCPRGEAKEAACG